MKGEKYQELGRHPMVPVKELVGPNQPKRRRSRNHKEFGSTHSTLRSGEPATWGRG